MMSVATDEIYAVNRSVIAECERLRKNIQIISDKNHGPLEKTEIKSTLFPFVLLLGNHSSGKSSFVNYLMDRKIQTAGVAPTDDNFTIIAPGETDDIDRDGSSLVGDPDLGFQGLKHFGPVLVHRTQLKIRTGTRAKGFCVVDTPGMIDSPVVKDHFGSGRNSVMDRGYDFEAVCRWYAERADVILLFFDPDKPGTTGETLSILTNSLSGLDHKLHIILNKADQFLKIHDFARAYGSLCWNLSKVIPRKDLPQIHTMCLPIGQAGNFITSGITNGIIGSNSTTVSPKKGSLSIPVEETNSFLLATESHFLRQGYADLEESRMEVTREVFNAPKRRVDHEISRLSDSVYLLLMHCRVIDSTVSRYKARVWAHRITLFAAGCAVAVTTAAVGALMMTGKKQIPSIQIESSQLKQISPPSPTEIKPVETPSKSIGSYLNPFSGSKDKSIPSINQAIGSDSVTTASATAATAQAVLSEKIAAANAIILGENESLFVREYSVVKSVFTVLSSGIVGLTGLHWWQGRSLNSCVSSLISEEGYTETFSKLYARHIAEKDEFTKALWQRVNLKLLRSMTYVDISSLRRVIPADLTLLERILEEDIANLRRQASPNFPSSSGTSRVIRSKEPHRVAFGSPSISSRKSSANNANNVNNAANALATSVSDSIALLNADIPILSVIPVIPVFQGQLKDGKEGKDGRGSEGYGLPLPSPLEILSHTNGIHGYNGYNGIKTLLDTPSALTHTIDTRDTTSNNTSNSTGDNTCATGSTEKYNEKNEKSNEKNNEKNNEKINGICNDTGGKKGAKVKESNGGNDGAKNLSNVVDDFSLLSNSTRDISHMDCTTPPAMAIGLPIENNQLRSALQAHSLPICPSVDTSLVKDDDEDD